MLRSSIDLGTNTCLLLIVDWNEHDQSVSRVVLDRSTIVRLGEKVDTQHQFIPEAMKRTTLCLEQYQAELLKHGVQPDSVICLATSQARDAKNSAEFFSEIQKRFGFGFRTISGDEEARLTFLGALPTQIQTDQTWVVDIGGGSTELISSQQALSLDIGSVRFTERYLKASRSSAVSDEDFWECQERIDQEMRQSLSSVFEKQNFRASEVDLIAVAGTATTLAAWHLGLEKFDAQKIEGIELTRGDIHRMVEELKWRTVEERMALPGMEPQRADVILAGAMILWRLMELFNFPKCQVSTRGLRYGALRLERL